VGASFVEDSRGRGVHSANEDGVVVDLYVAAPSTIRPAWGELIPTMSREGDWLLVPSRDWHVPCFRSVTRGRCAAPASKLDLAQAADTTEKKMKSQFAAFALGAFLVCSGCSSSTSSTTTAADSCDVTIDTFKELIVVDESVLSDKRAQNAVGGAWSFRHVMEQLAPPGVEPGQYVLEWLRGWVAARTFNGLPLDRPEELREKQMEERVICPWLRSTPANACNDDCSACSSQKLDLAVAPFRLIAISNRVDLAGMVASIMPAGEGRLVFGLTRGPADDPASPAAAMTVGVEYGLPNASPQQWAADWHALSAFTSFDEPYRAALQALTDRFVSRNAAPSRPYGSALSQLRTNESVLNWIWQMREFTLDAGGHLIGSATLNTPARPFNDTPQLATWLANNADAVRSGDYKMPLDLLGGSNEPLTFVWQAPKVDEPLRKAFANGTCNGCHVREDTTVNTTFQVSPFKKGTEKLAPQLLQEDKSVPGSLKARAETIRPMLCAGTAAK
jgi:hypothetical protein